MELTPEQLERQDKVDNAIHDLLDSVANTHDNTPWNIEYIVIIRDAVEQVVVAHARLMTEMEFYPYFMEDGTILIKPEEI